MARPINVRLLEASAEGDEQVPEITVRTAPGQMEDFEFLAKGDAVESQPHESIYCTPFGKFVRRHMAWVLVK